MAKVRLEFENGKVKVETDGFRGRACTEVTASLIRELGATETPGTMVEKEEMNYGEDAPPTDQVVTN